MSKKYSHIKQYEKEILELKNQGLTQREIAEKLGFSKEQIKEFFTDITEIKENYLQEYQTDQKEDREKWSRTAAIYSAIKQVNPITV